jgi:hypothetical protein
MDLQPTQFFHGTRANIPVGGKVLPSAETGVEPNHEISHDRSVYLESGEKQAWEWADGFDWGDDLGGEHTADSATVKERLDIMPGRQGTFPSLNWNQFGKGGEYNHPSDADIVGGHDGFERKYRPHLYQEPGALQPERPIRLEGREFPEEPDPHQGRLF